MGSTVADLIDGVWVGTAENNDITDTNGDDIYNLGGINDTIIFDISNGKTIGNNTVILSKGETVNLHFEGDTSSNTFRTGKYGQNGICITIYNGTTELGKINIEDPYKKDFALGLNLTSENHYLQNDFYAKTINKSKAKKGQIIKGSFYNEIIEGSNKNDKIYTGTGKDSISPNKGKDTIIINGVGEKEIYSDYDAGNNTFKFVGDGADAKTTIYYSGWQDYRKVGKNLYIEKYNNNSEKVGTDTISNFYDLDYNSSNNNISVYTSHKYNIKEKLAMSYTKVYGNKKRIVLGSHFDDLLYGSKKADKIYSGNGNDYIYAGKGNDKIYLNSGNKRIYINNGDGNNTVYLNEFTDDIYLTINGADDIRKGYSADGKDLILYHTFSSGKSIKTEKTILKNFDTYWKYNGGSANLYINGQEYNTVDFRSEDKNLNVQMTRNYTIDSSVTENKFFGTKKADNVIVQGTGSAKMILTGGGDDTITVKNIDNTVSGGAGNDTINVETNGTIYINHTTGDGNDIITVGDSSPAIYLNLKLQGSQFSDYSYYADYFVAMRQGFSIKDNDLVMQIPAGLNKFETITFKDFFAENSNFDMEKIYINMTVNEKTYNNSYTGTLEDCFYNKWALWATGEYDNVTGRTVYESTPDHKNYFYYGGKGKATMLGNTASGDTYIAALNKNSNLHISDSKSEDKLFINAKQSDVRVFFNVNTAGNVDARGDGISDDLFIFNKSSLTAKNLKNAFNDNGKGFIRIDEFFENGDGRYTKSDGYIENIYLGKNITNLLDGPWQNSYKMLDNKLNIGATVYAIAEKVAAWLGKQSLYSDAMDVINHGSSKDIEALLSIYKSTEVRLDENLI